MDDQKTEQQSIDHSEATPDSRLPTPCPQCPDYLAGWKRAQADYANLKKDVEREKSEFSKYANERLLSSLLPAFDQYDTAISFAPDVTGLEPDQRKRIENWIVGLKAIRSIWENTFQEIGLEKVAATGTFDPLVHEAAGEEASGAPEHSIIRVLQNGWRLNGKLLRPARVILARRT